MAYEKEELYINGRILVETWYGRMQNKNGHTWTDSSTQQYRKHLWKTVVRKITYSAITGSFLISAFTLRWWVTEESYEAVKIFLLAT